MKKIVTVSVLAIMAVSAANADIASTTYVDKAKTAVEGQITDLSGVVATKAAQADLNTLGGRVTTAEGKITTAEGKISTLEGTVAEHTESITKNTEDIATNAEAIQKMNAGNLVINDGSIAKTKLTEDLQNEITNATQGVSDNAGEITTIKNTMATDAELKVVSDNLANNYTNTAGMNQAIADATDGMAKTTDINDNTLTITVNNANAQTFTANAAADKTINIPVPTKVSDLTNDSKFQTESEVSSAISTATKDMATNSGVTETLKSYATTASLANATVANAGHATTADKATGDAKGNNIEATYATKVEVAGYVDPTELNTALKDYSTTIQMNSAIAEATADMATDGEVSTVKNELTTEINKKANQSDLTALTTGLGSLADVQIPELPGECKGTDATADCTLVIAVGADNALTAKWEKVAR